MQQRNLYINWGCGSSGMRVWRLKIDTHRHLKAGEAIYIKKSMRSKNATDRRLITIGSIAALMALG